MGRPKAKRNHKPTRTQSLQDCDGCGVRHFDHRAMHHLFNVREYTSGGLSLRDGLYALPIFQYAWPFKGREPDIIAGATLQILDFHDYADPKAYGPPNAREKDVDLLLQPL